MHITTRVPGAISFAYSIDVANLLTAQLTKFTTLNSHQLPGHVANLDFWLGEARHALDVIDGYPARFDRLKAAQTQYASSHRTIEFSPDDPCCTKQHASVPRRIPGDELSRPRRQLCDAVYRFLVRCFRERLLDESRLLEACQSLDISVESRDLRLR